MHLLVTNDDGIQSPGLLALAQALKRLGDLTVLAPDRNWSASGHVKTMHRPIRASNTELADGTPAIACDGAPSDCVALAVLGLVERPIDLVVAGINPNANLGYDVTYSGTVTAAMEATIAELPGLAVSLDIPLDLSEPVDFEPAAQMAADLAAEILRAPPPDGVLLNMNVPYGPHSEWKGALATRQGLRLYRDELVRRQDPRGRPYYWIGGEAPSGVSEPGTDYWALSEGYVSITPLQLDLTAGSSMQYLQGLPSLESGTEGLSV